jgi:DNA-binding transcriptional LysR family regulator
VKPLRSLRHAIVLARHGNYARAARELNLSQPSLTRRIALLEEDLGVTLFDRTRSGVVPTAFGKVLIERGDPLLRGEAALQREIQLLAGLDQGSLFIGAAPYPTQVSVGPAIGRLISLHPGLRVQCMTRDPRSIQQEVALERLDLGIAAIPSIDRDSRLLITPVPPQRLYLACRPGHPLLALPGTPDIAQVLRYPLVTTLLTGIHAYAMENEGQFPATGISSTPDFSPSIQVDSLAMGRQIAWASDAVFPGTEAMLADDVALGRLVRLATDAPMLRTVYAILQLKGRTPSPAAQAFIDILLDIEREQQSGTSRTE